ncbi:putative succinyl-CoA:3-ketoacid coenzyme A transferase subunit A [Gordonia insulae]|uniref:Putative succinyl-CoA:3-ketoacid coenzyme A transferase subunit A n=2 Tax=Gordonia insulae TaxID=2420509 RepID=A0A3G8JN61_9ACTN|nr:putative succinyl-CoA:3-ketoacid coenzyme A transferase subunit A [Gordonia insulae]
MVVGGFGLCGVPHALITAVEELGIDELEVYSNNCGVDDYGLGILLSARRIRRVTASYVGENKEFARQYLAGELEVELTPQGTLAERMRAGGVGIPAFYTPAGVGTPVADGGMPWRYAPDGTPAILSPAKETREFGGRRYVLEEAISADVALVRADIGDTEGNLVFDQSALNFNPLAAMSGRLTIAEVGTLVEPGRIDPASVHLPGIFVDRIVQTGAQEGRIEKRTTRTTETTERTAP